MPRNENLTVRRAIPALHAWPGDVIRKRDDGVLELVRPLPSSAAQTLEVATTRGDVGPEEPDAGA